MHGGRALKVVSELPPIEELTPPHNDGAAAHLPGVQLPAIELPSTEGGCVALSDLVALTVVFVLPSIGGIDGSLLEEWTAIPGRAGARPRRAAFEIGSTPSDRRGSMFSGSPDSPGGSSAMP